jgi:hypothetical protein
MSHEGRFSLGAREDRLAWIFGSSRSGSTWLLRMLGEVDQVVGIDDPHLGHHLGVWRPIPLAWAAADELPELTTLREVKREKESYFFCDRYRTAWARPLRELIVSRFEAQVRDEKGEDPDRDPMVLVKEPGSHAADLLLSLFPASGLVFLLRDGRDVVDSWMAAYRRGSWGLEEGTFPVAPEGRLALVKWQSSVWLYRTELVQRVFERHRSPRKLIVRYEQLRRDPAAWLQRVCSALNIDADPRWLAAVAAAQSFENVPQGQRGGDKEIRSASPGGWRHNLNAAERRAMHEIMGPKLAELGYLEDPERGDIPLAEAF